MSIAFAEPEVALDTRAEAEQRLDLGGVSWSRYLTISGAIPEGKNVRIIYLDGRLTFATTSRRHDFWSECFGDIVKAIATVTGIGYAVGGRATFRREDQQGGVEGDETFYLGENARKMRGSVDVELATQPPPDLAIEVEVSNPADLAMLAWGRLGVPEVWRFQVKSWSLSFWLRQPDGSYSQAEQSSGFPTLRPDDVTAQLRLADDMEAAPWVLGLHAWTREVLVPRRAGGG